MQKNIKKKYKIVEQLYYIDENDNKYEVDGRHVILDPTEREREVAKMLGERYGGEIKIIPRVDFPKNIKTPDYIINDRKFDLKQITGKGKYVIEGNIRKKLKQANNFIIDITNAKIDIEEVDRQLESIYRSKRFLWIDEILVLKENILLNLYKRKPTVNHK